MRDAPRGCLGTVTLEEIAVVIGMTHGAVSKILFQSETFQFGTEVGYEKGHPIYENVLSRLITFRGGWRKVVSECQRKTSGRGGSRCFARDGSRWRC
jgi:hypothetical protein